MYMPYFLKVNLRLRVLTPLATVVAVAAMTGLSRADIITVISATNSSSQESFVTTNGPSSFTVVPGSNANTASPLNTLNGMTSNVTGVNTGGTFSHGNFTGGGYTVTTQGFANTLVNTNGYEGSGATNNPVKIAGESATGSTNNGVKETATLFSDLVFSVNTAVQGDLSLTSNLSLDTNGTSGISYAELLQGNTVLYVATGNDFSFQSLILLPGTYELKAYTSLTGTSFTTNIGNAYQQGVNIATGSSDYDLFNITPLSAVPEPSSMALAMIAVIAVALGRRYATNCMLV